jgi:hypothetical protein
MEMCEKRAVPNTRIGLAWNLMEMGSAQKGEVEGWPGPPDKEGDKQSTPSKEGGNMEQEEEGKKSQV